MSSRNAITWLDAHDAFNRRDLDSVVAAFSPDCVYTDQARGITLVGISLTNLDDADEFQLELPFGSYEARHLDAAVDLIRDRYGTDAISRGALLGRDPGVVMPLLPD